jgi:RNA polymerase sigma factor (sigma-70 family)
LAYPSSGDYRSDYVMAAVAPQVPAQTGDQAFEILYRTHVRDVYRYALALVRNPADAEDVTQTTFLNAYRAFQRGEEIQKPRNWLIKIAHNTARSRYARAGRRVREVPLDDHLGELAVPEDVRPDVAAVLDALAQLPLNQRAALVMRELGGRTYAEIADTLGVSVSAVETLIFRGRRSLRLHASSLRALGLVPLPGSLASMLDFGGMAGAGGALAGSGLMVKLALAVIAGVVSTGITADQVHRAQAAGQAHAATRASHVVVNSAHQRLSGRGVGFAARRQGLGPSTVVAASPKAGDASGSAVSAATASGTTTPTTATSPGSTPGSSPPPAQSAAPPAAAPAPLPVVTNPLPSLPVTPEVPPVPAVPAVPPLPPVPPLPALPPVPPLPIPPVGPLP